MNQNEDINLKLNLKGCVSEVELKLYPGTDITTAFELAWEFAVRYSLGNVYFYHNGRKISLEKNKT